MAGDCTFCLTLSLFVEVLVPSQDRKRSYKCVLEVPILHLSMIFFIGFFNCSDSVVFLFLSFLSFFFHFIFMAITEDVRKKNESLQKHKKKHKKTGRCGYIEIKIKLYLLL
jgi:hypothetical protein